MLFILHNIFYFRDELYVYSEACSFKQRGQIILVIILVKRKINGTKLMTKLP